MTVILPAVQAAIEAGQEAEAEIKINNTNRVAGTCAVRKVRTPSGWYSSVDKSSWPAFQCAFARSLT
jgi:uncharacterized membrane protein